MEKFTNDGLALITAWFADPSQTLKIKWFGLSDGHKTTYSGNETEMTVGDPEVERWHGARYHGPIERIYVEAGNDRIARFEGLFKPGDDRQWTIEEVALFAADPDYPDDETGEHAIMVWIGEHPASEIPALGETMISEVITIPIEFVTAAEALLDLTVDLSDAALATVRDLMQMTLSAVSYASYRDLETAEMIGLIRARLATL